MRNCLCQCDMPDFELKTIAGELIKSKNLLNKVVVLNFWFTTCTPCIRELPVLREISEYYANKDVVFISISTENTPAELERFIMKDRGFGYQMVSDKNSKSMMKKFSIGIVPQNYVIDKSGRIKKVWTGIPVDADIASFAIEMKETIDKLL